MNFKTRPIVTVIILGAVLTMLAGCGGGSGSTSQSGAPPVANRYAVIIAGGIDENSNGLRAWDDCAYFYTTLKQNGFSDDNIYVVMSNGFDPTYNSNAWTIDDQGDFVDWYLRTPLDLDADGRPDVRYPADKASISCVFDALADRVGPNDILYIFVSDHGGPTGDNAPPYPVPNVLIFLWDNEVMTADEFGAQVDKVKAGAVVGIFGQCNSGGFVEKLAAPNRVLMSASRWWEGSYANAAQNYDAFLFNAVNALANPQSASTNGGGQTTMEEAYLYALANDPYQSEIVLGNINLGEHPSYYSNPWDLGRKVSLQGRLPAANPPVYAGFVETETGESYPSLGQAQGWHADDAVWTYGLPFSFPFGGNSYNSIYVSSNGIIYFSNPSTIGVNSPSGLAAAVAAAPLWNNLTTADPQSDIFIDAAGNQVTIAWVAATVADGRPVNVAARLQSNGVITFFYGSGNDLTGLVSGRDKTIGLSLGSGVAHYSLRNGASSLGNALPVSLTPVKTGS